MESSHRVRAGAQLQLEPADAQRLPAQGASLDAFFDDERRAAQRIDELPESARREPATRFVRAVAAAGMGQREQALELLQGLAERLPGLGQEIAALEAECRLEVGPFESAAEYYSKQSSPRRWLQAARAWSRAGHDARAQRELARVLAHPNSRRDVVVRARRLRAEIAERDGRLTLARRDYRWLALEEASADADVAYERLARAPLTKAERLRRAEALAELGRVGAVTRELAHLKRAPGRSPATSAIQRCVAQAHYRSRSDYGKAAQLYEQLARRGQGSKVSDWFRAAEAWSREGKVERAESLYRDVAQRYARGPAAERARYSLARLYYRRGDWDQAARAYTRYLQRYARSGSKPEARFADASRYERALSRLASGRAESALQDIAQLLGTAGGGYPRSLLQHLEGVALASSSSTTRQALAVHHFERVISDYPLSFAALASSARLAQLGQATLPGTRAPVLGNEAGAPLPLPLEVRILAENSLYSAAERVLHARESGLFRQYSPRAGQALCEQYGSLNRGFRRLQLARSVLRRDILRRLPTGSNLWAWQCLHPRPFVATVHELERRYDLPSGLLHSVMRQESAFRPDARSPAGAVGLMQLMPATAERAAGEIGLPYWRDSLEQTTYNLRLGSFYLSKLLGSFDQRVVLALASYNAGPHAVSRWLDGGGDLDLDLWVARIPYRETRDYVQRVMASWARYRYLTEGPGKVPQLSLRAPGRVELQASAY